MIFNDELGVGMNLCVDNELGYYWVGGSIYWVWSSGLIVLVDEWLFVVMVIIFNVIIFYLNDEEVICIFGSLIVLVYWGCFRVGSY